MSDPFKEPGWITPPCIISGASPPVHHLRCIISGASPQQVSRNFEFEIDWIFSSSWILVSLSRCQHVNLSACQPVNLSTCQLVNLSICEPVNISTCQPCQHVNMSILNSCQLVKMSTYQPINMSTCQHVNMSTYQHVATLGNFWPIFSNFC